MNKIIEANNRATKKIEDRLFNTKPIVIRHYLLPYNEKTQTQTCGLCGQIIHDYKNTMSTMPISGWQQGEHYITIGNPTYFSSQSPPKDKYNIVLCNLTIHTN